MKPQPWFERNTGSRITTHSNCECRLYPGRTHCFGCVITRDAEEKPVKFDPITRFPNWWEEYNNTVLLSPAETRFINGIPEPPKWNGKRRVRYSWRLAGSWRN